MGVRRPRPAWDTAYEHELEGQLLTRVRWGVVLCLAAIVFALIDVNVDDSVDAHTRVQFLYLFGGIAIAIAGCTVLPLRRHHSRSIALGYALCIVLALAWYACAVPNGLAVAAASLTALAMGCAILFPWGAPFQLLVATVVTLVFATLTVLQPDPPSSALVSVVFSTAIVSTAGAAILDRYRHLSFARAWQQDRLVSLGRDLQETRPPDEVADTIARHALAHLPAEIIAVALRHFEDEVYRVAAVGGADADAHGELHGFEVPADSPMLAEICARPHLLMPSEAPGTTLAEFFADRPHVRSLYVALRHGTEIEGIISWTRSGRDFAPAEIEGIRQFVTHAALGLRTARAISELRQINRLKSEFVSTVSHELRTPLNVILGYSEMARDPGIATTDRDTFLDRIEAAGRELLDLIESTLEVGRLEAAQSPIRLESVKLADFWSELEIACCKTPRAPGVRLVWGDGPDASVITDPHKLSVITRNLVGNACKFTTQGEVRAQLRLEPAALVLEVIDTGIGISDSDRQVIFELFRQGDSSDSRRYGGTGLGLYIVQRFCTQLGGAVDLESRLGAGAHFTIRIPVTPSRRVQHAA
jgi:signal transduction histidine kinase